MKTASQIFNSQPRVLIVDNNERMGKLFAKLTSKWGFMPILAEGQGNALLDDARNKARELRCQLALVDMRLVDDLDEDDTSGLQLVSDLKPAISIIVSASGDLVSARESRDLGAASFISKDENPEILRKKLEDEARKRSAYFRKLEIKPDEMIEHISDTITKYVPEDYHDQVIDIFSELFPNAKTLHLERLGIDPQSPHISSVPRPKSVVLKVREDDKQPVIVKLARRHKIELERQKYNDFIEGRLVGQYKPHLISDTVLWDIGGAKFTHVGISERSFSQLLGTENIENVEHCLEQFFGVVWSDHYKKAVPLVNVSLFDLYCTVWGPEWYERARDFTSFDPTKVMDKERWDAFQVPHPLNWFLEHVAQNNDSDASFIKNTFTAITHGDLHGDNLLVDENYNAWVIDFERSGPGHILQDFIELESDIINRLHCDENDFRSFYKLCVSIARSRSIEKVDEDIPDFTNPEIKKALKVISILRTLAAKYSKITNAKEYILGLLFNTIFRATLIDKENEPCQQRALMLVSILCHRLDHWDEPWPPQAWQEHSGRK